MFSFGFSGMSCAIDLDGKIGFDAGKVCDVSLDRVLAAKFQAAEFSATQLGPEDYLGIGHVLAEFLRQRA